MAHRYILFFKPFDVLSTFTDPEGRKTLGSYVTAPGVYAAGRLDQDSEGLMLLTDDGRLAHVLTDPEHKLSKTYFVQVENVPDKQALVQLRRGVLVKGEMTLPAEVELLEDEPELPPRSAPIRYRPSIPTAWLRVVLREGRKRQIRHMTAAVGHPTLRIVRVAIGPLTLRGLEPGQWRDTEPEEFEALQQALGLNRTTEVRQPRPAAQGGRAPQAPRSPRGPIRKGDRPRQRREDDRPGGRSRGPVPSSRGGEGPRPQAVGPEDRRRDAPVSGRGERPPRYGGQDQGTDRPPRQRFRADGPAPEQGRGRGPQPPRNRGADTGRAKGRGSPPARGPQGDAPRGGTPDRAPRPSGPRDDANARGPRTQAPHAGRDEPRTQPPREERRPDRDTGDRTRGRAQPLREERREGGADERSGARPPATGGSRSIGQRPKRTLVRTPRRNGPTEK